MQLFGFLILVVAVLGLVINAGSIALLVLKNKPSLFHHLLKILAISDSLVVICCAVSYGVPHVWPGYLEGMHPLVIQWVFPLSHMVVVVSIYSTVLISLERYVRICFFCQLRHTRLITQDNFKYYLLLLILGPVLFYLPKFFEVTLVMAPDARDVGQTRLISCVKMQVSSCDENRRKSGVLSVSWIHVEQLRFFNYTDDILRQVHDMMKAETFDYLVRLGKVCNVDTKGYEGASSYEDVIRLVEPSEFYEDMNFTAQEFNDSSEDELQSGIENNTTAMFVAATAAAAVIDANVTSTSEPYATQAAIQSGDYILVRIVRKVLTMSETALRKNPYYYQFYYVYLNSLVSSIVPLLSLLYLNIYTVRALKQIMRQDDITDAVYYPAGGEVPVVKTPLPMLLRKSVSNDNLDVIIENPLFQRRSHSSCTIDQEEASQRRRESLALLTAVAIEKQPKKRRKNAKRVGEKQDMESLEQEPFLGSSEPGRRQCETSGANTCQSGEAKSRGQRDKSSSTSSEEVPLSVAHLKEFRSEQHRKRMIMFRRATAVEEASLSSAFKACRRRHGSMSVAHSSTTAAKSLHSKHAKRNSSKRRFSFSDPDLGLQFTVPPAGVSLQHQAESIAKYQRRKSRRSTVLTFLDFGPTSPLSPTDSQKSNGNLQNAKTAMRRCQSNAPTVSMIPVARERNESTGSSNNGGGAPTTPAEKALEAKIEKNKIRSSTGRQASRTVSGGSNTLSVSAAEPIRLRRHSRATSGAHSVSHSARRNTTTTTESGSISLTVTSGQPCFNERSQERRLTRISISIVWLFIFCHVWKLIPTVYEAAQSSNGTHHEDWPTWLIILENVSHLLITTNSAVNFLIYLFL